MSEGRRRKEELQLSRNCCMYYCTAVSLILDGHFFAVHGTGRGIELTAISEKKLIEFPVFCPRPLFIGYWKNHLFFLHKYEERFFPICLSKLTKAESTTVVSVRSLYCAHYYWYNRESVRIKEGEGGGRGQEERRHTHTHTRKHVRKSIDGLVQSVLSARVGWGGGNARTQLG